MPVHTLSPSNRDLSGPVEQHNKRARGKPRPTKVETRTKARDYSPNLGFVNIEEMPRRRGRLIAWRAGVAQRFERRGDKTASTGLDRRPGLAMIATGAPRWRNW